MKKLTDLREYLLQRIPQLKTNPDQLLAFIENGKIAFSKGENFSHRYFFEAVLVVTDWRSSADDIVIPVLEWLSVREPGFDQENALIFESELLNHESLDLVIKVNLTERVIVDDKSGTRIVTHVLPAPPITMNANVNWQFFIDGPLGNFTVPKIPE